MSRPAQQSPDAGMNVTAMALAAAITKELIGTRGRLEEVAELTWAAVERARAEEALARSEEKYRTLFDSIDEGFCIAELLYDENGGIDDIVFREVNRAFERQSGVTAAVGKSMKQVLPPSDQHWRELIAQVTRTRQPVRAMNHVQHVDRWFDTYLTLLAGSSKYVAVVFNDVTERKRREADLQFLADISRDLERLTNIAQTMDALGEKIGRHMNVPRCAFIEINEAADEIVCEFEWHQPNLPSVVGVHRIADFLTDDFVRCLRRGDAFETRDIHADPRVDANNFAALTVVAFVAMPIVRDGELQFALAIYDVAPRDWRPDEIGLLRELTARIWNHLERARAEAAVRESEERLRVLIESVKDYAIVTLDPVGRITSWNEGARRMKGYTADEILGHPVARFYLAEDVAAGQPAREMQQALTIGRSEVESWRMRKDGTHFWVNEIMTPLRGVDGRHLGFTKISRDLTERKAFEDALRRAHDELEQRVRERTAALARANALLEREVSERRSAEAQIKLLFERLVSIQEEERRRIARDLHDQLGQQLTALRMNLEVHRIRVDGDADLLAHAQRTQRLAEELDRTIDFLTWQLRPAALDHLGLSAALQGLVTGWTERFGIPADFHVLGAEDVRLPLDVEANLYRIVQEALHNVVKHADATQVTVFMECRDKEIFVVVEDNGRGFDTTTVINDGHRHLGLVSMRERATLAGGRLDIESTPGTGSAIIVRIPQV